VIPLVAGESTDGALNDVNVKVTADSASSENTCTRVSQLSVYPATHRRGIDVSLHSSAGSNVVIRCG